MQLIILASARRHGVADAEMIHAWRHAVTVWEMDDDGLYMFVGPDRAARLLEVGVVYSTEGSPIIVHAMPARRKYLR